jgi:tetratricopeptide (TPR) repeat protein/predicted Ser/Thr protein kinase
VSESRRDSGPRGLSPERWREVDRLFAAALELPTADREAFVAEEAGSDAGLAGEVRALLESAGDAEAMIGESALRFADPLLTALGDHEPDSGGGLGAGARVGSYRIIREIGYGGMGAVYLAERADEQFHKQVAIKVVKRGMDTDEILARFRHERQILATLEHEGIARLYDGGATDDGRPYLVMEYVDGRPLTAYCDDLRLDVERRLVLFRAVCDAVQFAHQRFIVHRDLKPSNVLVAADGTVKLLDFGLARVLQSEGSAEHPRTSAGRRIMTPEYAAPEQILGRPVTTATDVYALGAILYQLLAGRRPLEPFQSDRALALQDLVEREPERLSAAASGMDLAAAALRGSTPDRLCRQLRGDLDCIVGRALEKEPARRYQSPRELADDIGRHVEGLPVVARPATVGYRVRRFLRRHRARVVVGAILVGLAGTSAVYSTVRIARERDRAERERTAAEDVIGLLTGLFERANPMIVPGGDTVQVAALLTDGERGVEGLAAHPDHQARMWRVLGNMRASRGEYAEAGTLLRRSWELQRQLRGSDDVEAARTYHELAVVEYRFEGSSAARSMLDTSLAQLRKILGRTHADVATALQDRAAAAASADEERRLLDEAVAVWQRQPQADSMGTAALLNNQGSERFGRGDYAEAQALFGTALRILERRVPPEHPNRLALTRNLASTLSGLGEWEPAESLMRQLVAHTPRTGNGTSRAADSEVLALLAAHQGRLEEAEAGLRTSLATLRGEVAADHWRIDNTLRNLGLVVVARGRGVEGLAILDSAIARSRERNGGTTQGYGYMTGQRVMPLLRLGRLAEAAEAARESERVLRATVPEGHGYLATLALWQGEVALARGDASDAEPHFREALRRFKVNLPERHPSVAGAACLLGAALVRQGRPGDGRHQLETACPVYQRWGLADSLAIGWGREALAAARAAMSP